jgi:hypothetical protein
MVAISKNKILRNIKVSIMGQPAMLYSYLFSLPLWYELPAPLSPKGGRMRPLRKGDVIKFTAMDDFTGEKMKLIGEVIGDYEAVRHQFPEECSEAEEGVYLVGVGYYSALFVVAMHEVLEVLGIK